MRPSRVWFNRMKPAVIERGYAREAYDRQGEGQRLVQLAIDDGFVAEMRGGFVHVATQPVVAKSIKIPAVLAAFDHAVGQVS